MQTHTDVELVLAAELDQVLVAANTSGFQGFRAQLFVLVRHQVDAQGEILHGGLLATEIEDTDLRIWDTTAEPRLRVWLILTVAITEMGKESEVRKRLFSPGPERSSSSSLSCEFVTNNIEKRFHRFIGYLSHPIVCLFDLPFSLWDANESQFQ